MDLASVNWKYGTYYKAGGMVDARLCIFLESEHTMYMDYSSHRSSNHVTSRI